MHNRSADQPKIQYRHFNLPANFPVIGLLGDSWQSGYQPVTSMHYHNCIELGMLSRGSGMFLLEEERRHFTSPCIVIAPPNMLHANYTDPGTLSHWNWIYVDPVQLLPHLPLTMHERIIQYQYSLTIDDCIIEERDNPQMVALLRLIIEELGAQRKYYTQTVAGMMQSLFLALLRSKKTSDTPERPFANPQLRVIAPAIEYIATHYMQDVSIEAMAQLCHLSTSHFRRIFRRLLGWSPLDYVQMIRIDKACVLLYDCRHSVTQIGMLVGYSTPSSFGRQFRKQMGVSPSQWRIKMQSEENPVVTAYFDAALPASGPFSESG